MNTYWAVCRFVAGVYRSSIRCKNQEEADEIIGEWIKKSPKHTAKAREVKSDE